MRRVRSSVFVPVCAALALLAPGAADAGASVISTLPASGAPVGVAHNPPLGRTYVGLYLGGGLQVIDTATNTTIGTPTYLGGCPVPVAVNVTTNKVYVGDWCSSTLHVLDGTTLADTPIALPGGSAGWLAIDEAANKIYATPTFGSAIRVIDGATNAVTGSIPMPSDLAYGAVWHGGRLYVAGYLGGMVYVSDGTSITGTIPVSSPVGLAIDQVGNRLFVASSSVLHVVDLSSSTVVQSIPASLCLWGLATNSITGRLYVADYCGGVLMVFDGSPLTLQQSFGLGAYVYFPAVDSARFRLYTAKSFTAPEKIFAMTEDDVAPSAAFTTPSGAVLRSLVVVQDTVNGTVTDDYSGVDSMNVTFTHSLLGTTDTVAATVTCGGARRLSCTWSAPPPLVPGPYTATISGGADRAGAAMPPGGSIAITVV